jgi:hypothetical protein
VKWIEAGKIMAVDPDADVLCPQNKDGKLIVFDTEHGNHISRYLICVSCKSYNVLLLKVSSNQKRANLNFKSDDNSDYGIDELIKLAEEAKSDG